MLNKKKLLFILIAFALIIRVFFVIFFGVTEFAGSDSPSYNEYAKAILSGTDWITNPDFSGNYRSPVYPMFIALIYAIFGVDNYIALYIFQAIIGTITCFFIYLLSKKIFDRNIALISLFISSFYIYYLQYVGNILRETLVFFFIIAFFHYLYCFFMDRKYKYYFLSIIIFTLLIHTDARYLFYLPFLFILFWIFLKFKISVKYYLFFISLVFLLMIPWAIRNYIAYDGFVLINTRTLDLRRSNRNEVMESRMNNTGLNFNKINTTTNVNYPSEKERELIKISFNPNNRIMDEINAIKKNIYPDSTYIQRTMYNIRDLWRPCRFTSDYRPFPDARFEKKWSIKHNLLSLFSYGIIIIASIISLLLLLYKRMYREVIFLTFAPMIQTLLHILMWGKPRYRIPIDCFIIILSSFVLYLIYEKITRVRLKGNLLKLSISI